MQIPITLIAYLLALIVAILHQVEAAPVVLSKRCPPGTQPVSTQAQAYSPAPNPFGVPGFSCVAMPASPAIPAAPVSMPIPPALPAPPAAALPGLPTLPTLPAFDPFAGFDLGKLTALPALPQLPGLGGD